MREFDKVFDDVFGTVFNQISNVTYPPYNIRKTQDGYVLEVAAAGFTKEEIDISLDGSKLTIVCTPEKKNLSQFIHQGLTYKPWTRVFSLSDLVELDRADFVNGLLQVFFTTKKLEEKKPLKINIGQPKAEQHPQLLNEDSTF